jgi:hypothetical protein
MGTIYTISEAADALGLSRQRVYLLVRLHGVPTRRGRRGLELDPAAVETLRRRPKGQGGWRARAAKWADR